MGSLGSLTYWVITTRVSWRPKASSEVNPRMMYKLKWSPWYQLICHIWIDRHQSIQSVWSTRYCHSASCHALYCVSRSDTRSRVISRHLIVNMHMWWSHASLEVGVCSSPVMRECKYVIFNKKWIWTNFQFNVCVYQKCQKRQMSLERKHNSLTIKQNVSFRNNFCKFASKIVTINTYCLDFIKSFF